MNANEGLHGPLGQAIETIQSQELPDQQISEISQRVIGRLSLETQRADSMQGNRRYSAPTRKQAFVMYFLAASLLLATSVGIYRFNMTKRTDGVAIATKTLEPSTGTSLMQFVPMLQAFTVQRPGSLEPTDVLVICQGPSEVVALGDAVALSPALGARYIHVIDPRKPELSRVLRKHEIAGRFVLTPDQRHLLTHGGQLLDLDSEELRKLPGDWDMVQSVRFVANDRLFVTRFATPENCVVSVLTYPELKVLKTLTDVDPGCLSGNWMNEPMNWSERECALVFTDRKIRLTSTSDFKQSIELETIHSASVELIVNSADGKFVASATEQELLVHDASSGKLTQRLQGPEDSGPKRVDSMAFSPDGKYFAVGFAQHLVIFDTATWQLMKTFPSASGGAGEIIWSPDAKSLVTLQKSFLQRQQNGSELLVHPSLATWSL